MSNTVNGISEVAYIVESWIDEYIQNLKTNEYNKKRVVKPLLSAYKVSKTEAKMLYDWFSDLRDELDEVVKENDEDLCEGWDFLTAGKVRKLHSFVDAICNDLEKHGKIVRRKRARSPEQAIKKLKYEQEGCVGKTKLKSFDPKDILKANAFITFNTKTNDLCYYETKDVFDIKGTTVYNFDENASYCQKIGRVAEKFVSVAKDAGVSVVNMEMKKFKTSKRSATGRINDSTILLRVLR